MMLRIPVVKAADLAHGIRPTHGALYEADETVVHVEVAR